ncbi:Midkine [Larimichthys crocea]|nr:Midkine [Larimichthys crocea]
MRSLFSVTLLLFLVLTLSAEANRRAKAHKGDCKYKFGPWGSCDAATNTKSRSGTLKRALFNAECQITVKVSKPCSPKVKKTRGDKKSN